MKFGIAYTLGACVLALSATASATGTWQTLPGSPKGHAAVALSGTISSTVYFLNNTWGSDGWHLQKYDFLHASNGIQNVGTWQGTSLAMDQTGSLWLVYAGNSVHEVDSSNWSAPPNACEGGVFFFRLENGHNNLAVQNTNQTTLPLGPRVGLYAIDGNGRVRTWDNSGNCWLGLPFLPSGFATNEIAIKPNTGKVWAADANGYVFVLNGLTWAPLDNYNGRVKALGGRYGSENVAIGYDNMSLYNWNDATGWTYDPDWQHWQFLQFGTTIVGGSPSKFVDEVAVELENTIWAKVQ